MSDTKLCKDCQHFGHEVTLGGWPWCKRAHEFVDGPPDLVWGGKRGRELNAYDMREPGGPCGPEGRLHEKKVLRVVEAPKPKKMPWWRECWK